MLLEKVALELKRLPTQQATVRFQFDGVDIIGRVGDSVAAALLASGSTVIGRHQVSGAHRGPYCLMGTCYECLVEIDQTTTQACQVQVVDGLKVKSLR